MAQQVRFEWLRSLNQIAQGAGINQDTMRFIAADWNRLYDPFVPFRHGPLSRVVQYVTTANTAKIIHRVPYARRIYHGRNFKFGKRPHALACAYWDKAAAAAGKKQTLIDDVQRYIRR